MPLSLHISESFIDRIEQKTLARLTFFRSSQHVVVVVGLGLLFVNNTTVFSPFLPNKIKPSLFRKMPNSYVLHESIFN